MPDGEQRPPTRADVLVAQGSQYHIAGNIDAARVHYDAALLLDPDHPIALQNLSGILFSCEQNWAAVSVAKRAVRANPKNPAALANHAASLMHLGQLGRAQKELEIVLETIKQDPGIWHNYSLVLYMQGKIDAALRALTTSIMMQPTQDRLSDRGIFTLATGDLQKGLELYECRWNGFKKSKIWDLDLSEWRGENLFGKRILVHHEQGLGDGIMLFRFVDKLTKLGAEVTIATTKELLNLFGKNSILKVVDWTSDFDVKDFDFHSPMLSMVRWLGIERGSIDQRQYLFAPEWPESLPEGFKVGICWESGDHSPRTQRRRRIVPLEMFFSLAEIPGVRLVSLQKGPAESDILRLGAESFILNPMPKVQDFYDTAQIIRSLDLVVSVDSAVAHLAGAMGKPMVMLGPYTRCWRWWGEKHGLPWYNNFRIFAQETHGDWSGAMKKARNEVERRVESRT